MDEEKSIEISIEEKLKLLILERDDTLYILQNDNIGEISTQAKFYEETLNEIRTLQRKAKREKVQQGIPLAEIKQWDEEFTAVKRNEEELYYDMLEKLKLNDQEERASRAAEAVVQVSHGARGQPATKSYREECSPPQTHHNEVSGNPFGLVPILESV